MPGSVYSKLYKNTKRLLIKSVSSVNFQKSTSISLSSGASQDLYSKGLKSQESVQKFIEIEKKRIDEEHKKIETFKPSINRNSSKLARRTPERAENILLKKGMMYQLKLDCLKENALKAELNECSFMPSISTTRTSRSRDSSRDVYSELHYDASKRKSRNNSLSEQSVSQYPYKPHVRHRSKSIESKEEFLNRLHTSRLRSQEELNHVRQKSEILVDKLTGKEFFKPQINRKSLTPRNTEPKWKQLYALKDNKMKKIEDQSLQTQKFWEATIAAQKASDASQKIFRDFRAKQFHNLFKSLDSDCDGNISYASIKLDHLDVKSLMILNPLLTHLEESKLSLDFTQFEMMLNDLMKNLTVEDKAYILKRDTKKQTEVRIRLVSPKSARMAEKRRASQPHEFYDRLFGAYKLTELKASETRKQREEEELEKCTFMPNSLAKKARS